MSAIVPGYCEFVALCQEVRAAGRKANDAHARLLAIRRGWRDLPEDAPAPGGAEAEVERLLADCEAGRARMVGLSARLAAMKPALEAAWERAARSARRKRGPARVKGLAEIKGQRKQALRLWGDALDEAQRRLDEAAAADRPATPHAGASDCTAWN